jgi:hypothetical protein
VSRGFAWGGLECLCMMRSGRELRMSGDLLLILGFVMGELEGFMVRFV